MHFITYRLAYWVDCCIMGCGRTLYECIWGCHIACIRENY